MTIYEDGNILKAKQNIKLQQTQFPRLRPGGAPAEPPGGWRCGLTIRSDVFLIVGEESDEPLNKYSVSTC